MMYMIMLLISMNLFSWWWFWMMLEILNWFLITWMKKKVIKLLFLLWQSLSSLLLLFYLLINLNFFFYFFFFFMKMSLPPFQQMFWKLHIYLNWKIFIIFMTLHKFLPMMFMTMFFMKNFMNIIIFFPLIIFYMFWNKMNLISNLFMFLMSDSFWMIIAFFLSLKMAIVYMLVTTMMFIIFWSYKNQNKENISNKMNLKFILLLMFSLPPFFTFLIKFNLVFSMMFHFMGFFLMMYLISIFFYWEIFYLTVINLLMFNLKLNMFMYLFILIHLMFLFLL
uniref:NADH dehydrogenase subunit 2 n=1 Tax=Romanomermis culicivorax TaxID=13658 RepID=A1EHF3_ROMCU|nr:NADH dehydrogenase subunit 2 [Romanomermis culicivorax]ABL11582.1 NADH dehydrogenase subunit 2 [Romanomermis culicivorax]